MTKPNRTELLEQFATKCRAHHLSLTPQRIAIYKALLDDRSHPSPDKIYQTIKPEFPTISLATVYKTLETFEQNGIISRVTPIHNTVRYDIKTDHHHHVVCIKCKQIMDIESKELDALKIPDAVAKKNKFIDFSVHISVICKGCIEAEKTAIDS
jgi:Fur family transcriptional regulator, peroxide stress response regulator